MSRQTPDGDRIAICPIVLVTMSAPSPYPQLDNATADVRARLPPGHYPSMQLHATAARRAMILAKTRFPEAPPTLAAVVGRFLDDLLAPPANHDDLAFGGEVPSVWLSGRRATSER